MNFNLTVGLLLRTGKIMIQDDIAIGPKRTSGRVGDVQKETRQKRRVQVIGLHGVIVIPRTVTSAG